MTIVDTLARAPLRKLFLVTVTCKIAASFLAWYLRSPWLLGFIVPLAFMGAYILLGFWRNPNEVSDERFGDSCYYLGFIFTISSIAFSLFDIPDLDKANRLTEVAVRFGAAMVSTFIGFMVRVYLVGFRQDMSSAMQSLEEQIIQSAKTLQTRLEMSQEAFRDYEAKVRQAANDTETRVRMAVENVGRQLSEEMASALRALAAEVQALHRVTAEEMRTAGQTLTAELTRSSEVLSANLQQAQSLLSGFGDQLSARLRAITFPDDYFTKALSTPLGNVVTSVTALSQDLNGLRDSVRSSASSLAKAMEKLDVSMEAPQSVRELVDKQEALARQAVGALSAASQSIEASALALKGGNESLARIAQQLSTAQASHSEVISAARDMLQSVATRQQAHSSELESLSALVRKTDELLAEHRKLLEASRATQRTQAGPPRAPDTPPPPPTRPESGQPVPQRQGPLAPGSRSESASSSGSFFGWLIGRGRK